MGVGAIILIVVVLVIVVVLAILLTGVGIGVRHHQEHTPGSDITADRGEHRAPPGHTKVADDGSGRGERVG